MSTKFFQHNSSKYYINPACYNFNFIYFFETYILLSMLVNFLAVFFLLVKPSRLLFYVAFLVHLEIDFYFRLKSVIYHFRGNREFARLRIGKFCCLRYFVLFFMFSTLRTFFFLGIGRPPGQMDSKAFLLQKFNNTAQERVSLFADYNIQNLWLKPFYFSLFHWAPTCFIHTTTSLFCLYVISRYHFFAKCAHLWKI